MDCIQIFARLMSGSGRRVFFTLFLWLASTAWLSAAMTADGLRCEHAVDPLGVDAPPPALSWQLRAAGHGQEQTAYQILAASSAGNLAHDVGDLWDSGRVESDETLQVPYAGSPLKSWQQVFWKVRVWDAGGHPSAWSRPATWTMGVLRDSDWQARWIAAPGTNFETLLLRREFAVKPGLRRALVNVCGLGQYEMTLNGKKVGDDILSPGWTKYDRTCLYDTRDITADLKSGQNAVGLTLAKGMYDLEHTRFRTPGYAPYTFGPLKAIAQIRLEYADGSVEFVGTDGRWQVAPGPWTAASIYSGEDYDARRAQPGWDQVGFDDAHWLAAQAVAGPGGKLRGFSAAAPPIRGFEVHRPVASWTLTNDDVVFDLGQNAAHVPSISVTGPAGSRVKLTPAELTNSDGSVTQSSMGGGQRLPIYCDFTKATDHTETWSPKFFYVGCRYFQVHAVPAAPGGKLPRVKSLSARVIHADVESTGDFSCSNDLFNRIRTLVRWAQRNNMVSVMTDCPHREKRGWLEQDHLNGPALRYESGLAQLFTKTADDIADSQLTNGLVPTTAPEYTIFVDGGKQTQLRGIYGDSPEWSSAFILVPWQQYEFDGDTSLFRHHYDAMKRYVAYLGTRADHDIINYGLGDWYDLGPKHPGFAQLTPVALTATAFYYQDVQILSQVAGRLGRPADAKRFELLAGQIRDAFNARFYNPTNRDYATGSQCANAMPLVMGLCDPANRGAVLDAIVRDVRSRGNGLTAGDVGYRYLLRALAEGGRSDVIFDINDRSDKPGYGMQLQRGATSLTEAWDAGRDSSQDHFMMGQITEWFYHDLAGIQDAPGSAGFKRIIIAPQPVGDVTWVKARYRSVRGEIGSAWKRSGNQFTLAISIPPNTTATVLVPDQSGKRVAAPADAQSLGVSNGCAAFAVGSGKYVFTSRL